ncbi:MAG TPA: protein kinase [Kofleriaceae bacterium]|nr:protein kinase [Kofleriaceae bacterium]
MGAKLASGSVIDERYRIVEPLGSGGMGHVYRAEHLTLRRQVAVKVLHHSLSSSEEMRRRFEREAFAAARLDHANCATAFDFGSLPDGSDYFVAELLDGVSLQDLLEKEGRLAPLRALHILGHVLRGLGHMHGRGVVHRDIKPDNVMIIERDGDRDFGRILDFGIAKLIGQAEADASPDDVGLTSAGTAIGTPAYIAPEQAMGQDIDGRADLYAATSVLFKMLTGRPPFAADTAMQLVMKHATNPPPSLAAVAGRPFSGELEALVARGLAKQPSDRFGDAAQYLDALGPVVAAERNAPASVQPQAHASTELAMRTPVPGGSASPLGVAHTTPMPMPGATPIPMSSSQAWADYAGGVLHQVGGTMPAAAATQRPWRAAFWRTWRAWGPAHWIAAVVAIVGPLVILAVVCNASSGAGYDESITKLVTGKTCEERREAVASLRRLGDTRAIAHLKKARYRMRGGVAGIGDSNTNACLKADAERAIEALSK